MSADIIDFQADLLSSLESALDASKFLNVFQSLLSVINEQQQKINDSDSRINDLYDSIASLNDQIANRVDIPLGTIGEDDEDEDEEEEDKPAPAAAPAPAPSPPRPRVSSPKPRFSSMSSGRFGVDPKLEERIKAIEDKYQELEQKLAGGDGDNSVLKSGEGDPYQKFLESSMGLMGGSEESSVVTDDGDGPPGFMKIVRAVSPNSAIDASLLRSTTPKAVDIQVEEKFGFDSEPEPIVVPMPISEPPEPNIKNEILVESAKQVSMKMDNPLIAPEMPTTQPIVTQLRVSEAISTPSSPSISDDKESKHKKGTKTPSFLQTLQRQPSEKIPDLMFLNDGQFGKPFLLNPPQLIENEKIDVISYTRERMYEKRRMSARNFVLITPQRRARICKELRKRGMYLNISRRMLEDSRKRYGMQSLKRNVEYIEADLRRLYSKLDATRDVVKRNYKAIRDLLPPNFERQFFDLEQTVKSLLPPEGIEKVKQQQQIVDELPKPQSIVALNEDGRLPEHVIELISSQVTPIIMSDVMKLKTRVVELSGDVVTRDQLSEMLKPTSTSSAKADEGDEKPNQNTDPNHMKLMNLINKSIERNNQQKELAEKNKKYNTLALQRGASTQDLEALGSSGQKYTDLRLQGVKDKITKLENLWEQRAVAAELDNSLLKEKVKTIEDVLNQRALNDAELEVVRKKETEQLRILQRRIANIPVDKLVDELKFVQDEVKDRPNHSQVTGMMEGIEAAFRSHVGENVEGLRALLEQVYQLIQHKVDREDIKRLIVSKLAQMEDDILKREEESFGLASSTRCLSCGQWPMDLLKTSKTHSTKKPKTNRVQSPTPYKPKFQDDDMNDDLSFNSSDEKPIGSPPVAAKSPKPLPQMPTALQETLSQNTPSVRSEEVYSLLTGNVGLKSLLQHHAPMAPVKDPYSKREKKKNQDNKIPEPLYRKAKLAAHMKEMVKVAPHSAQGYGFHGANPFYVLDGMMEGGDHYQGDGPSLDDIPLSVQSRNSQRQAKTAALQGGGKFAPGSGFRAGHSAPTSSLVGSTSVSAMSSFASAGAESDGGTNIKMSTTQPMSAGNGKNKQYTDIVVLPSISSAK